MPGPLSFDNIMIGNPALTRSRMSAPFLVRALIKPEQVSPDNPIGATKARARERRSPCPISNCTDQVIVLTEWTCSTTAYGTSACSDVSIQARGRFHRVAKWHPFVSLHGGPSHTRYRDGREDIIRARPRRSSPNVRRRALVLANQRARLRRSWFNTTSSCLGLRPSPSQMLHRPVRHSSLHAG